MYRNKVKIISHENRSVDPNSLWRKRGHLMVLEDENNFTSAPYDSKKFMLV